MTDDNSIESILGRNREPELRQSIRGPATTRRTRIFTASTSSVKGTMRNSTIAAKPAGDSACPEQQPAASYERGRKLVHSQVRDIVMEESSSSGSSGGRMSNVQAGWASSAIKNKIVNKPAAGRVDRSYHSLQKRQHSNQQWVQQLQLQNMKLKFQGFILAEVLQSNKKKLQRLESSAMCYAENRSYLDKMEQARQQLRQWPSLQHRHAYKQLLQILAQ